MSVPPCVGAIVAAAVCPCKHSRCASARQGAAESRLAPGGAARHCWGQETFKVRAMHLRNFMLAALIIAAPTTALADPVADFYRGKQLKLIIRAAPGGNYDL